MHFLTFVLVPEAITGIKIPGFVRDGLAPYSAHLVVPGYEGMYPTNPEAEWDGFEIGGRWDGLVTGSRDFRDLGKNWAENRLEEADHDPRAIWDRNMTKVANLPSSVISAAIVTLDGKWHDEFSEIDELEEKDYDEVKGKWNEIAKTILSQHRECLLVAVDCHSW